MGADVSSMPGGADDPMEPLLRAMEQMQKGDGSGGQLDGDHMRQKLLNAKDSISQNFGNNPDFLKIVEELEQKSASDVKGEVAASPPVIPKASSDLDSRKIEFVFKSAADGEQWQERVEEAAQAKGLSGEDIDEDTLVCLDANGKDITTETEDEPDWASLAYPVSGYVYCKVYEVEDVSWAKDGSLLKQKLSEGDGEDEDMPQDSATVKLKVLSATDGTAAIPGFKPFVFEFVAGNGDACDALEIAAVNMKMGEKAELTCSDPALCDGGKFSFKSMSSTGRVVVTLELIEFKKINDPKFMSLEVKIKFGTAQKASGSELFRQGRTRLALLRYKTVLDLFVDTDSSSPDRQTCIKDLRRLCELNRAACHLQLLNYSEAEKSCNFVLGDEPNNVKALYRRAQCHIKLKNNTAAIVDLRKTIELDPPNKAARALLKEAQANQKEEDDKSKGMFAKMLKDPKGPGRPEEAEANTPSRTSGIEQNPDLKAVSAQFARMLQEPHYQKKFDAVCKPSSEPIQTNAKSQPAPRQTKAKSKAAPREIPNHELKEVD